MHRALLPKTALKGSPSLPIWCASPHQKFSSRHGPCLHAVAPQATGERHIVVGIDLGTTNSAVAYIEDGVPKCIPCQVDGDKVTPSVVAVLPGGEVEVGKRAKRQAAVNPQNTFYSVKRLIGRKFDHPDAQAEIPRLAYKVRRFLLFEEPFGLIESYGMMRRETICQAQRANDVFGGKASWGFFKRYDASGALQVDQDEDGAVVLPCEHVETGSLYPEEVSAQVRMHSGHVTTAAVHQRGRRCR